MIDNAKISEKLKINSEVLGVSSGAGTTSQNYDMAQYDKGFVSFCLQGDFTTVVVDLMQSSASTVAGTSAAAGKTGIVVGGVSTLINSTDGVTQFTFTMSSATGSGAASGFSLTAGTVGPKLFAYDTSTALDSTASTAWTSTLAYFGSTLGSTVNTGIQLSIDNLKTAIDHQFPGVFTMASGTTANLQLTLRDQSAGSIGFGTTNAFYAATVNQAVGAFDFAAEDLTSTLGKRYVSIKVATAVTSVDVGVTMVRSGARYSPVASFGKLSS